MYILGLHSEGNKLRAALLKSRKGNCEIIFLKEFEDLGLLKKSVLKESGYREDRVEVVSALSSDEVFIRNFEFPLKQRKKVLEALPFQIESVLPFSQEGTTMLPIFHERKQSTTVTLYSYRNEVLKRHLDEIHKTGFDSDLVTCIPTALLRFTEKYLSEKNPIIFHFTKEKVYMVAIKNGTIVHSLVIKQDSIHRALESLIKKESLESFDGILISGILHELSALPLPIIKNDPRLLAYAIEIGLALERVEKEDKRLQFRVGEFVPKRQITRLKRRILSYLGLTAISSGLTFATLVVISSQKERAIQERFHHVAELQKEQDNLFRSDPAISLTELRQQNGTFVIKCVSPTEEKAQEFTKSLQTLGAANLTKEADGYKITLKLE